MRIGILGYGNLGRGIECAIKQNKDMELAAVFTRRNPADVKILAEGKCADFAVIDLKQPNMQPVHNIPKNLVYSGSKQNVYMTVVNGKILYENGKFLTVDANEVYARAEKLIHEICG